MEIIILAVLVATRLGPPITRGGNVARHNAFCVWLPHDAVTESQGQSPAGRKAQEVGEWRALWIFGIAVASPVLWQIEPLFLAVLAFFLAAMLVQTGLRLATDSLDYMGHGIEIMVAEDEGRAGYREAEIARMVRDRDRKGMTVAEVDRKLRQWNWLAVIVRKVLT